MPLKGLKHLDRRRLVRVTAAWRTAPSTVPTEYTSRSKNDTVVISIGDNNDDNDDDDDEATTTVAVEEQ